MKSLFLAALVVSTTAFAGFDELGAECTINEGQLNAGQKIEFYQVNPASMVGFGGLSHTLKTPFIVMLEASCRVKK